MKLEVIRKDDIPDWEFGDVTIKKFSFNDKIRLASFISKVSVKDKEIETNNRDEIDSHKLSLYTISSGLYSVKDKDNYEFVIKPNTNFNDKLLFVESDSLLFESGQFLASKISVFNKVVGEELKKKSEM